MTRIVAHLIAGAKAEPFLPAMLASIAGPVERLFVNENSGMGDDAPNLAALASSLFAQSGRMSMTRTVFNGFAQARNHCFALDTEADENTWIAFIDADEVHGAKFAQIAAKLGRLPSNVAFVDGYTWHFFKSFDWYSSIERRMMFHRWSPRAHWEGGVHEQLAGIPGKRIALPYVYAHYGHVTPFAEDARKGAQYSSLGAEGTPLTAEEAHAADFHGDYRAVDRYFAYLWRVLMPFRAEHPPAARPFVESEKLHRQKHFAQIDAIVRRNQPPLQRVRNALMKANYEQRWRGRVFEAARYGML